MTFTPKRVIYPASLNPDEIIVAGEDENGRPVNAPILTDPDLARQLRDTPTHIPNPDYQTLAARAFAKSYSAYANRPDPAAGEAKH